MVVRRDRAGPTAAPRRPCPSRSPLMVLGTLPRVGQPRRGNRPARVGVRPGRHRAAGHRERRCGRIALGGRGAFPGGHFPGYRRSDGLLPAARRIVAGTWDGPDHRRRRDASGGASDRPGYPARHRFGQGLLPEQNPARRDLEKEGDPAGHGGDQPAGSGGLQHPEHEAGAASRDPDPVSPRMPGADRLGRVPPALPPPVAGLDARGAKPRRGEHSVRHREPGFPSCPPAAGSCTGPGAVRPTRGPTSTAGHFPRGGREGRISRPCALERGMDSMEPAGRAELGGGTREGPRWHRPTGSTSWPWPECRRWAP